MSKKISKNTLLVSAIIIAGVLIAGAIIFVNMGKFTGVQKSGKTLSSQTVGKKVVDFINKDLLKGRGNVSLVKTKKENGLYEITINLQGRNIKSYATLDGRYLYPERFDMDKKKTNESVKKPSSPKEACKAVKKTNNPKLEAFVVSSCPFGLEMQRILSEIWKNDPNLMANIKVRYIGAIANGKITSMHGDKEAKENLKQICIREEQPTKYWNYVSCYIKKGDSVGCSKSASIDKNKLNKCETDPSRGLKYAKEDFSLQGKYGVSGSPTLILNGKKESEFNFGGRTAEAVKDLLCCGFNKQPKVCSKKLSTESAAVGFSKSYSSKSSGRSGSCK